MLATADLGREIVALQELRELIGEPTEIVRRKQIDHLDEHCRRFIAHAPFLMLGTADATGRCDVSPRGDAAGFVRVLDDRTLVIPERPGNRLADSLRNIIENPRVGLIFLIPNVRETLRVNGRARLVTGGALLETMAARGKRPLLGIVVEAEEVTIHCAKAFIRSGLWEAARHDAPRPVASLAQIVIDHTKVDLSVDELQQRIAIYNTETL